jgi:serine/threonine protein kinase
MLILFFFLVLQSSASQVNRLLQMHPDVIYVKSVRRIPASGISSRGLSDLGYEVKPRSLGYYFSHDGILRGAQELDPNLQRRQKIKSVYVHEGEVKEQFHLKDSKSYKYRMVDGIEEGCSPQYHWQTTSFPTCNRLYEYDLVEPYILSDTGDNYENMRLINNGFWRDVFMVLNYDGSPSALKTMRYQHDYEARNYDRHRKDALASDRLTSSPYVVNIYGFCGNSAVFDYASGGDIEDVIWPHDRGNGNNLNGMEKLDLALQVARGISAAHNFDREGRASLAHTDITPGQFIYVDGRYQLNDFNRARLITWDGKKNQQCPYYVQNNPGKFRSPEEYAYEGQSEKVDIYSMGNIFYSLLTNLWPFSGKSTEKAQQRVLNGSRPKIGEDILQRTDEPTLVLLKAMNMSWVQNPGERSTAREVEGFLEREVERLKNVLGPPPQPTA